MPLAKEFYPDYSDQVRQEHVDRAFQGLLKKVRRKKAHNDFDVEEDFDDDGRDDGEEDDFRRSSEDDANSENLGDFSGLEGLNMSEDEDQETRRDTGSGELKRKKPKQRDYPNARKQRGYHKWAGRSVALLSTGETGIVVKKPGGRIKVRLDDNPSVEISSSEEKLHLMETAGDVAIEEIFQAALYVPQYKDLHIGQRVAMTRFDNATGKVLRLPDEKRVLGGLGHVIVQLENPPGETRKSVLESLRLIADNHPVISLNTTPQKVLGRPTKAEVARKSVAPHIDSLVPLSKQGYGWKQSLKIPTGHTSPPQSPVLPPLLSRSRSGEDEVAKLILDKPLSAQPVKKVKQMPDGNSLVKPSLNRGQKFCKSCNAVIGTASRICSHCGAPCPKGVGKNMKLT